MRSKLLLIAFALLLLLASLVLVSCYSYTKIRSTANPLESKPKYKKIMLARSLKDKNLQQQIDRELNSIEEKNHVEFIPWMKIDSNNIDFIEDWMSENEIDGIMIINQDSLWFKDNLFRLNIISHTINGKEVLDNKPKILYRNTFGVNPLIKIKISLYDLNTGQEVWNAVAETEWKNAKDPKKIAKSFSKKVFEQLKKDRMIPR